MMKYFVENKLLNFRCAAVESLLVCQTITQCMQMMKPPLEDAGNILETKHSSNTINPAQDARLPPHSTAPTLINSKLLTDA